MERAKVVLKSGKDQSVRRYHPWVFSGAIKKIYGHVNEGDIVDVYDNKNEFLALGHYQVGSIAVRIFSFEQLEVNQEFWAKKIKKAFKMREDLGLFKEGYNNTFRLFHAEGDGIPGLIIDFYNGTAVMQTHSVGVYLMREQIVEALKSAMGEQLKAIYDKSENTLPFKAGIEAKNELIYGEPESKEALEYGNKFLIDWEQGQKTGFFVDQRENRKLLGEMAKGRDVLNMFCYTGGFSVYAMQGGANMVHSVDASARAIDLTNDNIKANFPEATNHEAFAVDAFEYMQGIKDKYDLIILDPPAFAKHHNVLHNALQGYKKLNRIALEQIRSGGILFTFSCSQVVSKENFRKMLFTAAANTGRTVKIMHQLSQPLDHPVNIYHPEGEYLKGLVVYVE